jgi:hypothetical protein
MIPGLGSMAQQGIDDGHALMEEPSSAMVDGRPGERLRLGLTPWACALYPGVGVGGGQGAMPCLIP